MAEHEAPAALADPARIPAVEDLAGGLGGRLRVQPEDFQVEELPLFRACGRGDHALVQVEKRGVPTLDVLLFLSKQVKVSERRMGYAGLKDARAVARQWITIPKTDPARLQDVRHPTFRVLSAARHDVPLKIGHLRGNRFAIRIRECDATQAGAARAALERLARRGVPNAYGIQRFGTRLDGHLVGRAVLAEDWQAFADQLLGRPHPLERNPAIRDARAAYDRGDLVAAQRGFPRRHRTEKRAAGVLARGGSPKAAFDAIPPAQRRIWVSAWQSFLFNRVLARRIEDDTYDQLLPGDVARLSPSGAQFAVTDPAGDAARAARGDASPTGPLVGYGMPWAEGTPGALERQVVAEAGVDADAFGRAHARARGTRRPLRIPLREASLQVEDPTTVLVRFVLPPGAFATVVLDHLMRRPDEPIGVPTPG